MFKIKDKVIHPEFGTGKVLSIAGFTSLVEFHGCYATVATDELIRLENDA